MAITIVFVATNGVGTVTNYQWTVRRLGADPRNQIFNEHMLALVEAPDWETAKRAVLDAPGVTLYDGQRLKVSMVRPDGPDPTRVKRALNANTMRERLVDGYDDWVIAHGRARYWALDPSERAEAKQRVRALIDIGLGVRWLDRKTAWLLRQRDTGRLIYVVANGVWRTVTADAHDFARWLCGPYRRNVPPDLVCQVPDNHAASGWCPLRDRSYDAVAIARRVGEDRVKVIVLDGDAHWFDTDARPASRVIVKPVIDAMGRQIASGRRW